MVGNSIRQEQDNLLGTREFIAIAAMALLLGAAVGIQSAYAVAKLPNYKIAVSNPSTSGCTYDPGNNQNWACVTKNVDGNAETSVKDNRAGAHWAQVYHEMNPTSPGTPSTGFELTQPSGYNNIQFRSYLDAKVSITKNGKTAEVRYGGNIFQYNTATAKYELKNYFYAAKTTDGTYTITNIYVYYNKAASSGTKWTMGSLFESYVNGGGFGGGYAAYADAYVLDRYWKSNQLEMISTFSF